MTSRRDFLTVASTAGAALALGGRDAAALESRSAEQQASEMPPAIRALRPMTAGVVPISVAERQGCTWGQGTARAEASAHRRGGWKQLVRHEHTLARRWAAPCGSSLKPQVIEAGHHWVPSILMDEATRELVTCSYDGTVRFCVRRQRADARPTELNRGVR